ncbi:hypothetical protein GCM10027161_59880 [Microbispora hainanensis]
MATSGRIRRRIAAAIASKSGAMALLPSSVSSRYETLGRSVTARVQDTALPPPPQRHPCRELQGLSETKRVRTVKREL